MNNIFAQRRSRLLAMKALRERYVPNEKAMISASSKARSLVM